MKANKHTVHIDQALSAKLKQFDSGYKGDYSAFKQTLSNYNSNYVRLDDALELKLGQSALKLESSWKKVAAVFWFRRLRNTSIILFVLIGLSYGIRYTTNIQHSSVAQKSGLVRETVSEMQVSGKRSLKNESNTYHELPKNKDGILANITGRKQPYFDKQALNNHNGEHISDIADNMLFEGILYDFTDLGSERQLKRSEVFGFPINPISAADVYKTISALNHISPGSSSQKWFSILRGLTIGVEISNSFQTSRSLMGSPDTENTNRNYAALSDNGRRVNHVINYGIVVEKSIYRGFGISTGIQKQTLNHTQTTDFVLNEAPVYDLDGSIAGYIQIVPERIAVRLENTVSYIAVPLYMTYHLKLGAKNSMQMKLGSGLLCQIDAETEKFDYKSLVLKPYNQPEKRFSMRQVRYGLGWTRQLPHNVMLSFAFERQDISKVAALSDQTERIQTNTNNFIVSLKFKL